MEGPYYIQPLEIYNLEQMSADIPGTHYALSRDLDIIKVSAQSANVVSQEIADGVYVLLQGTKEPHENALLAEAVIVGKMITDDNDPEFLVYDVNTQEPDREHMFEIYDLEQITADIPGTHLGLSTNLNIVTVKDQSNDIVTWEIANNIYVLRSGTKQDNEQISIGTVKVDEYSPEIVFLYDEVLLQEISMTAEELSFINTGLVNTHWGLITDYNEIMLLSNDSGDILAGKINNYLHVLLPATELPDGRIQAGDSIFDTSDHELKITVFNEQMSAEEDLWEGEIGALLYDTQNAGISINLNMLNESPVITQGPVMTPELVTAGDNAQLIIAVMDEGQLIGCEWIPEVGTVEGDTYYVDKSCPADAYYMIAQADDNNGGMAFAFIRIGVLPYVNIAPVIAPIEGKQVYETNNLSFAVDGSDADGDSLTYNAQNLPDGAQLSADGVFGWTPQINQAGSYTVTFIANDGQADSNSEEVTINVLILGDMNADGTVDLSDLKLFKTAYRSLDPAADLNNDGILTNADYKILKENLGRSI
ncbi:MAG: hypothetical protein KKD05_07125 [Candidatus Omnitrophica bacterium]|nr:hypothetical protein [Candidatus Omnitrophota bacterium]